jgi:hypothetical protein
VEARNNKGDVEVTLPPNASATVNARTHNGDIVSDYSIPVTEGENKMATFKVGSGASRIVLSASNGDVRIKKGPGFPSAPSAASPAVPSPHKAPNLTGTPRLKEPKIPPEKPVTQ